MPPTTPPDDGPRHGPKPSCRPRQNGRGSHNDPPSCYSPHNSTHNNTTGGTHPTKTVTLTIPDNACPVILTDDQLSTLHFYLLTTTRARQDEVETWERLAAETKPDGTPLYENAAANADYCRTQSADIESILATLRAARCL